MRGDRRVVVIRGGQTSASIAFGASFRFRDVAGLVLFRVLRTSESSLAQGRKRLGTEKGQRARTGRTDRRDAAVASRGNDLLRAKVGRQSQI